METDSSEKLPSLVWKEPVNGKTAFFTEEVYRQLTGPEPTIAERAMKMMDALGFPPPSKRKRRRKTDDWDNPQNNTDCGPSFMSCSQDEKMTDGDTTAPWKQESAPCPEQEARPETEEKDVESKKDGVLETAEAPDILDSPLSPPSQEGGQNPELPQLKTETSEAGGVVPQSGDNYAVSTPNFASNSASGMDNISEVSGLDSVSEPSGSQGQGGKGFHVVDKSGHQPWTVNRTKRDNHPGDAAGQARFPGQRAKMHDKGRRNFLRPPPPEAPKSSLTHDQHIRYLHIFKKCTQRFFSGFVNPPTQHELNELKEFEALQMLVGKEQEECQAFLQQLALDNPYLYTNLPQHVSQYTQDKEQSSWKRAETYCRYYNTDSRLPLTASIPQPNPGVPVMPAMLLMQTLLEMGSKCKLVMPDLNPHPSARPRRTVSTDLQKVTARFPSICPSNQRSWNHEPASKDSNLEGLVQKYRCHIATSASVLQQLIDNSAPDYAVAWDIPVVVKEYGNGSASQKVVYLDKPLLPKGRSLCQKKTQYLQKALRAFVCLPHNERKSAAGRGRNVKEKPQEEMAASMDTDTAHGRGVGTMHEDDDDPFGSANMEDLETFGSDKTFSRTNKKVPDLKCDTVKLSGRGTGNQVLGNSVSVSSASHMSDLSKTGALGGSCVSEDIVTSDTKSDNIDVKEEDGLELKQVSEEKADLEPKQELKDKGSGSTTETVPDQSKHSTSSEPWDHGALSDSDDEGALVIDVSLSPVKSSGAASRSSHAPQHSMVRRSQGSRDCIFDEMPVQPTPGTVSCAGQSQPNKSPPKRMTRSISRLLSSDNENKVSCSASDDGSNTTDSTQTGSVTARGAGVAVLENKDAASIVTSPRTTRQSAKRKIPNPKLSEESETCVSAEEPTSTKKSKKSVDEDDVFTEKTPSAVDTLASSASHGVGEGTGKGKNATSSLVGSASEKQTRKSEKQSTAAPPTYLESILKEMNPSGENVRVKIQEDPARYQQPGCPGEHIGYHLWDLSGISMIVRCNSHCFVRDMRQEQKAVYVRAKPERHFPHGLEQTTLSECVRNWLGCYLRPNSYMLRVRVSMQNHEVVHTEELQLNQILQPSLNFSPQYAFAVLRNIFSRLNDLPAGSYLLSHESGADHIQLKAGTGTRRGSYDFRTHYMGLIMQEVDKSVPWVPLDPTLMLPHHWRQGLIPVTFQPPDFDPKKKKQQFVTPKKKFRNKKKKQN